MKTQSKIWLGIVGIFIIIIIMIGGFLYWQSIKNVENNDSMVNTLRKGKKISIENLKKSDVVCTQEMKTCSDGSLVARTGQNCEFAPCPEIVGIADKILISSIKPNDEISSPVTISGKARGSWFFEGSFPIEIYDDNNKLLIATTALFVPKSEIDTWMTEDFVDFKSVVNFNEPSADSGYILFKKDNPSGIAENNESFKLPVKFLRLLIN
ncbi:MAG: Gmad2 immunoglobulin-like domain-containing protein [Candidatus Moraniibacteriota bacterium]